ncbi:hypothetical protein ABC382_00020 [Lysinibacillus sp. 1P01SD]|uniref:hypothetical protein n=1 Tax=Lysinibacillus sp. 1P01SD TaxID=3132285 RepID=UPI0039A124F6
MEEAVFHLDEVAVEAYSKLIELSQCNQIILAQMKKINNPNLTMLEQLAVQIDQKVMSNLEYIKKNL